MTLDHWIMLLFFVVGSEIGPWAPEPWSIHCMVLYCRLLAEIVKPALVRGLHYQHTYPFVQREDVLPLVRPPQRPGTGLA